jgi:hypothetical protein
MPSTSDAQRRFMGVELERAKKGQKTKTNMTIDQLRDFARKRGRKTPADHAYGLGAALKKGS